MLLSSRSIKHLYTLILPYTGNTTSTEYFLLYVQENRLWFIALRNCQGLKLHNPVLTSLSISGIYSNPRKITDCTK